MPGKTFINLASPDPKQKRFLNDRHRLLAVMAVMVFVVLLKSIFWLAVIDGIILLILLWFGVSLKTIVKRMLLLVPFGAGALVFIPFTHGGDEWFSWFGFSASVEGLNLALEIMLKMVGVNALITYLITVTPLFELIRSLRAIGIPPVMIQIMSLMMRYFFLLSEEAASMMKAQKSRGFRSDGWLWSIKNYKRFGQMIGVLFIRAYNRSGRIYLSMSSREGFDGNPEEFEKAKELRQLGDLAIEVKNVSYAYNEIKALKQVSLNIKSGSKIALMGPNGAGKSTLISLLNGLEKPSEGWIRVLGHDADEAKLNWLRSRVGVVYQDPDDQIFSITVEEDVAYGPRNLGLDEALVEERVENALGSVGMKEYRKRSPFELSYGQKKRICIAGVLAMQPEILILDEPMAFLDPKSKDELQLLLDNMHSMGMTIMVATHDVDFAAEWADRVVLLKEGRVLAEGTTDLLFDDLTVKAADLHLPRLARPFRMLNEKASNLKPRTAREAAQMIWRLITSGEKEIQETDSGSSPLKLLK